MCGFNHSACVSVLSCEAALTSMSPLGHKPNGKCY